MKRLVGTVVALGVLVLLVLFPALVWERGSGEGEPGTEPTTITSYRADFDLAENGDLRVVEELAVDFPTGDRHGIFRFFDRYDPDDDNARFAVRDVEVTMDGDREPYDESREDGGRYDVLKIGDEDVTLDPGVHTYRISYEVPGVIRAGENGERSQFYWNLIPSGWQQDIDQAELTVSLPVDAGPIDCGIGNGDDLQDCRLTGEGTREITVTTSDLPDHTPVTVRIGLDLPTPPAGTSVPWGPRFDQVLGAGPIWLGLVLLIAVVSGGFAYAMARRADERPPGMPLTYAPPAGIGPAQAKYVLDEDTDRMTYVATMMYAAERGAVTMSKNGDAWTITDKAGAEGWAPLDVVSGRIAQLLSGPGTSFTAQPKDVQTGKRLKSELSEFEDSAESWAKLERHIVDIRGGAILTIAVLGALIVAVIVALANPLNMSTTALIPGAFGVLGLPLLKTGSSTRRTRSGRRLWSEVGGFKRILATPSAENRFDFSGREELYTAYIPWAVAFGCADAWAEKYRVETASEPPNPLWVGGYAGYHHGSWADSVASDFDAALGSAVSSYEATQRSSSSGGGFSGGGGGGGGGGGSW